MAKTSSVEKNERRKRTVLKYSAQRAELKAIVHNRRTDAEERELAFAKLRSLPRDANPNRVRNRCSVTGRSRGYMRRFGISRIVFRESAAKGYIPGLVKASW